MAQPYLRFLWSASQFFLNVFISLDEIRDLLLDFALFFYLILIHSCVLTQTILLRMLRIKHCFIPFFLKLFDTAKVFWKTFWINHCLWSLSYQNRWFLKILTKFFSILKTTFFIWWNTTLNIFLILNLRVRNLFILSIDLINRIKEIFKNWINHNLRDNFWVNVQLIFLIWVQFLLIISCLLFLWT
jgi:hypothetical protein